MSPKRTPGRTANAEDRVRANVLRLLDADDRSIGWLAGKMRDAGCDTSQQALWKALKRDRAIYVDEVIAMGAVLGVSISELAMARS